MKQEELSNTNNSSEGATSSCPVMRRDASSTTSSSPSPPSWWNKLTFASPTPQHQIESLQQPSACPMVNNNNNNNNSNNNKSASVSTLEDAVASLEEAAKYAQTPQPDQRFPLRTDRQVSSIPRGSSVVVSIDEQQQQPPPVVNKLPHHQPAIEATSDADASRSNSNTRNHWVYPSEQQLYNAMRRKGWQNVPEDSIPTVLQIHNSINERTWDKVLEWEYMMMNNTNNSSSAGNAATRDAGGGVDDDSSTLTTTSPKSPRLVRFEGRPKDMTPKAFLFSNILRISDPPFDRHDWYVESYPNGNNSAGSSNNSSSTVVQRYVIDYYMTEQHDPFSVPIPYVDARPAVDSPRAVWMRTRRFLQDAFPGITAYYLRRQYLQEQQQMIQQQQQQQQQRQLEQEQASRK